MSHSLIEIYDRLQNYERLLSLIISDDDGDANDDNDNVNNKRSKYMTKSASRGAHSPVRDHPRGSKVVPLNSWGRFPISVQARSQPI